MRSPSGGVYVPAEGPLDAEVLVVVESPGSTDGLKGRPLMGRAGRVFDMGVMKSGLSRERMRVVHVVPTRAPRDVFAAHKAEDVQWGRELLADELGKLKHLKVVLAMGDGALQSMTGLDDVLKWRGSVLESRHAFGSSMTSVKEDYMELAGMRWHDKLQAPFVIPTHAPGAVGQQFRWHPWFVLDMQRAKRLLDGQALRQPRRSWHFNDLAALEEFADRSPREHSGFVAFDTESYPDNIIGLATEDAVYSFVWDEKYRPALTKIMESPYLLKVAHNIQHDLTHLWKRLGIKATLPWFDTMGGAHVLHSDMDVNLSPAIATRYTDWPYHKWLVDWDALWYNAMDCVVAYDAYWPIMDDLARRGLYDVNKHDHELLEPLLDMQWFGFKVDEKARQEAEIELASKRAEIVGELQTAVAPIVASKLGKFNKPHLFKVLRRCGCCGGGTKARAHCWRCGGLAAKPEKKADYTNGQVDGKAAYCDASLACLPLAGTAVAALQESLPSCSICGGTGKVERLLSFNPASDDQVADVLYRGAGVRPRRYKGKESVRVGLLEPLVGTHPLVAPLVKYARVNAEFETVARLTGGADNRLHCVFDPLRGTGSGRVASYEGLIEHGTNAMNIPKVARRLVVPDDGMVFLYPDMASVEGRAIAVISKDKRLIEVFNDGGDLHALVRDEAQRLGVKGFSRDQAKRLDYAVPFGGDAKQIGKELVDEAFRKGEGASNITTQTTELLMQMLLNGWYRGVRDWHVSVEKQLLDTRQIRSITGRVFEFDGYIYDAKTRGVQREVLKQGYSREPQDIGAWVLAVGMRRAWTSGEWERVRGLIHVHDALLFQTKAENVEEASAWLTKWLTVELWGMKFMTNIKAGVNWKEAS